VATKGGVVRLAVVADTHGTPDPRASKLLREARPDAILHAGDIGDLAVLDGLDAIAPTLAVRGNIDVRASDLPDALLVDVVDDGESVLRLFMTHIAVYGPKLRADVAKLATVEHAAVVVCGHSHVPFIGRDKGLVVFNPGSIGPRRFHLPIVFGVLELRDAEASMYHVSCETGGLWEPRISIA
jgi:putative phosphoesterase